MNGIPEEGNNRQKGLKARKGKLKSVPEKNTKKWQSV